MSNLTGPLIVANACTVIVALYFWHRARRKQPAPRTRKEGIEFGLRVIKGEFDVEVSQRLGLIGDEVGHEHRVEYVVSLAREARSHNALGDFDLGYLSVMSAEDLGRFQ